MADLRGEERVAAATIRKTLGVEVEQHDDGRQPGMHDLNIRIANGATAAVEVTAAADSESIELWKMANDPDKRWIVPSLQGGWLFFLAPTARAKRIKRELPKFLEKLESEGITDIPRYWTRQDKSASYNEQARALGIMCGGQSRTTSHPGSIYLSIERSPDLTGGYVDTTGTVLTSWVREFLLDPHQADVLQKLTRSGSSQRHAFILVPGLSTAPFGVVDMLWRNKDDVVPTTPPDLPTEVTHVWLMAFWVAGSGLRWSPDGGWERFDRQFRLDAG